MKKLTKGKGLMGMLLTALMLCALVVPMAIPTAAAVTDIIDQECLDTGESAAFGTLHWQEFCPTLDNLTKVAIRAYTYRPDQTITLKIKKGGEILTTSTQTIARSGWSGWLIFDVPDIILVPEESYIIEAWGGVGSGMYWGGEYPRGAAGAIGLSGPYNLPGDKDWAFRTYGIPSTPNPDLTPTAITTPDDIYVGETASITATIANLGDARANGFDVALYADADLVDTQTVHGMAAGASTDVRFAWIPSATGDATLRVLVDSADAIAEVNETNNELMESVTVVAPTKPDLIPASLQPTILHLDQPNTLTATVRNDGGENASSFNVSLKLGEALIGTETVDTLNISEEKSIDFTWTPTSAGTFNLTVTVDPENVINEFDETNNVMEKTVTIPQPDLIPTSLQPTTLHFDQPNTLTATIRNDGGENASAFNASLKLGESLIGMKTVDALNIGEEKTVDFTWTPTSAGTFNLTVTADPENVIDEFDETNNAMTVMVTVERASTPFLISGRVNYENGDAVSNLTVTVTNLATSEEFTVKNTTGSNYYRALNDSTHVSAGDTIKINATDGTNFNETSHTVTADEMNGGGFGKDLTLAAAPDLTITKIALKTPGYANEENVLGVGVKNIGRADAGLFSVSLSVDGTPMGEQTVSSLAVGETIELEYTWTPADTGEYILSATADVNNEVEESDETNNTLARTSVIIKRTDWPQFHYDEVHLGFSSSKAPDTNETLWISDDISASGGTSSMVADGKVFAYGGPTGWSGGDGALYCLDEFTGTILWNVGIPAPSYGSWSSPAYHDGKVVTSTGIETGCYDAATGEQIWVFENPTNEPSVNAGPVIADGKVVSNDWQAGHYYCLDEETGELLWTFTETETGSWGTAYAQGVPAYADGKFYITTWIYIGGNVYCVDADTGAEIWHQTLSLDTCGSPAVVDGTVYVTTYDFYGDGDIYAMNADTGEILWQHTIQRTDSTPAVAYGNVYVTGGSKGFSDIQTYCFNATTGGLIWSTDASDEIGCWTCSVAVADGKVFVGKPGGWFDYAGTYALDAFTGDVIWSYPEGGSSPAVAGGTVFTIGGGRVYAFGSSEIPASVRIEPEILNLNASGEFTAFITLPEGYDVGDIVVSTVECEGAHALSGTIAAHDNGTLVVKFDREDLREDLPTGDEVEMTVTGELTDGTRFEGSDTVGVIAKGT